MMGFLRDGKANMRTKDLFETITFHSSGGFYSCSREIYQRGHTDPCRLLATVGYG